MPAKHRVVLTGAGGVIAALWIDALRERYDLVPVDVASTDRHGREIEGVRILDLLARFAGGWMVVEFKTDDIRSEAALAEQLEQKNYRAQIRRYQDALGHLLGTRPRALLCLLNYAGSVRWVEL